MPQICNSTNGYSASSYQVSNVIGQGNFLTIQDAIDHAASHGASSSNPLLIWIQAGIYTEDLNLKPYVSLAGASDPSGETGVLIKGNAIYADPNSGNLSLTNIGFLSLNSAAALSFQSTATSLCHLQSVAINAGSGIGLECTGSGMTVQLSIGSFDAAAGGICKKITDGFVEIFTGVSQFTDTASIISGGSLRLVSCDLSDAFVMSGGHLQCLSSVINSGVLSCIDIVSADSIVVNCILSSSATYVISGSGSLAFASNVFASSSDRFDPALTLTALPTSLPTSTTPIAITPYVVLVTDQVILVDTATIASTCAVTLPGIPTADGQKWVVKDWSGMAGTYNIQVNVTGGLDIDAANMYVMNKNYEAVTFVWDGALSKYSILADYNPTSPPSSNTATTDFGALAIGTARQNTLGYDILVNIRIDSSSATSATIIMGVGPTNTPSTDVIIPSFLFGSSSDSFCAIVPAGYYCLVDTTGTITIDSITTQVCPL